MKVIFKFLLGVILILSFFNQVIYAETFYHIPYKVIKNDNFASILKKMVLPGSIVNVRSSTSIETIRANPHVKNWRQLEAGVMIDLYISKELMNPEKYEIYKPQTLEKIEGVVQFAENEFDCLTCQHKIKGSLFYMSSFGQFNQKSSGVASVNFFQNSPITLGQSLTYYPSNKNFSYAFSFYYSFLLPASYSNQQLAIPPEIGTNIYGEYHFDSKNLVVYAGPDFEKFSSFNNGSLKSSREITIDNNSIVYATIGVSKKISFFQKEFILKTSIAKTVISQMTNHYEGYRGLLYLNHKFNNKIYLHALIKYHQLEGTNTLQSFRVGVGFGYSFF